MELKLPLVVAHAGPRRVEAWVPAMPEVRAAGPSLAEIRDDLALMVMERFESAPPSALGAFQMAPHASLKHVKVETVAHDRARRRRLALEGRLGVLLEKWPGDGHWVATPTRIPGARFALASPDELEGALARRLAAYCLENDVESLSPFHAARRERLDILEVDADPPSVFPRAPRMRRRAAVPGERGGETPEQRAARRRARRARVHTLRAVAQNLSHAAADGTLGRAFGRAETVRTVVDEFDGRDGAAVVLLGPPGVGKTALAHEFVRAMLERARANGVRRDVWRVDGNRFIAGMMYVGQWEARARELAEELADLGDVLYADDLLSLVQAGRTRTGSTNVAQFLEPSLARGEISVLAESTPERFERVREEAPTLASLFRVVRVEPMSDRETLPVLLAALREAEAEAEGDGERFAPAALETVLQLSRRFLPNEAFPGKAVRLLRATLESLPGESPDAGPPVREAGAVFKAFRAQSGLPAFVLGEEPPRPPEAVRAQLARMVAGQPEAVDAAVDVVLAVQHALNDPARPLATYLFVGPTGVGKTETAKALARYLFGDAGRLVRFDMSEFATGASVSRLIGHALEPDGELTRALRTQPFCVVLFDEIEKAHPRVFDALLQLLGEGRLTDAAGRTAGARQAVLVMTSNLGVREAASAVGFAREDPGEARKHYVAAVRAFFRPEFFNRIDRVVPFRSLDRDALRVVVEHALEELLDRRGVRRANVLVDVEPELLDLLVQQAYDPRYGARPLRRALERKLAVPLAHHLLRRRSDDLALVELFRRGDDMALGVVMLRDADPLPPGPDATAWGPEEVMSEFARVRGVLDGLAGSGDIARLEDLRAEALRRAGRGGAAGALPAGVELLEKLAALQDEVREIEYDELSDERHFDEETVHSWRRDRRVNRTSERGKLRPREGFMEVPLQGNAEAAVRKLRPRVLALRDEVETLAHLVRAAARGPEEHFTVLVEPATPEHRVEHLTELVHALPRFAGASETRFEAGGRWVEAASAPRGARRALVSFRGAGLRVLLEALAGCAVIVEPEAFGRRTYVLRVELLEGEGAGGEEAVRARDRAAAAERERRRAGEAGGGEGAARVWAVSMRTDAERPRLVHVATGLAAAATEAVAAAVLRARGAGGAGGEA